MNKTSPLQNKELLSQYIKESKSYAQVIKKFGLKAVGGNYSTVKAYIKEYGIDISHFTGKGWNTGDLYKNFSKKELSYYLVENRKCNSHHLKNRLIKEGVKNKECEYCKNSEWMGKEIPLELNHINGIKTDNRLGNLEIICPNCHAIKPNYRGGNKEKY